MEMSDAVKSVEGSEREKEMDAVSPAASEEASEESVMVGNLAMAFVVSVERVRELSRSAPSALGLPARSENAPLSTEISPGAMESGVGVNVAVWGGTGEG